MKFSPHDPLRWLADEFELIEREHLRRDLTTHEGSQQARLNVDGQALINFGSNDYLALAADGRLIDAAARAMQTDGVGGGASPLVTGHSMMLARLEQRLAEFEQTEAALVFSSGYAANMGTMVALAGASDVIYSDRSNHASIIDGCRLSRAQVCVYPHLDFEALEQLLVDDCGRFRRRVIVTESVFSMEGDCAPLVQLAELARQFDAMLVVDEAHATGMFGDTGRGLVEQLGIDQSVSVRIGTLSKSLGCSGGFVCGSRMLVDWLVQRARPYIFSTAPSPAICGAAIAALDVVAAESWRRTLVIERVVWLQAALAQQGWAIGQHASQIIPLVVGDPTETVRLSDALRRQGFLVPAIRPPSVPPGKSLLRISVRCDHTEADLAGLVEALSAHRPLGAAR